MPDIQQDKIEFRSNYQVVRLAEGGVAKLHYIENWRSQTTSAEKTLIFIHGLGANCHVWRPLIATLTTLNPNVRCVALDLPGHGKSSSFDNASMLAYLSSIDKFIETLNGGSFHLIGHSFGAALLMHSDRNPLHTARIMSYYLIAPVGIQKLTQWQKNLIKTVYDLSFLNKMGKKGSYESFCKYFANYQPEFDSIWAFIEPNIDKNPVRYFHTIHLLANSVMDVYELKVPTIFEPTHFIIGRNDLVVPARAFGKQVTVDDLKRINQSLFPNSNWHFIDNCGHYPQIEHHQQVSHLIISTL
ncbi:MAG: alpha/beta hydrolase [Saprospiraceae bacterium]